MTHYCNHSHMLLLCEIKLTAIMRLDHLAYGRSSDLLLVYDGLQ